MCCPKAHRGFAASKDYQCNSPIVSVGCRWPVDLCRDLLLGCEAALDCEQEGSCFEYQVSRRFPTSQDHLSEVYTVNVTELILNVLASAQWGGFDRKEFTDALLEGTVLRSGSQHISTWLSCDSGASVSRKSSTSPALDASSASGGNQNSRTL